VNKQPTSRGWPALLGGQLLALSGGTAQAQGGYPNQPITLIALFGATATQTSRHAILPPPKTHRACRCWWSTSHRPTA
jgi:hypothetical protein